MTDEWQKEFEELVKRHEEVFQRMVQSQNQIVPIFARHEAPPEKVLEEVNRAYTDWDEAKKAIDEFIQRWRAAGRP